MPLAGTRRGTTGGARRVSGDSAEEWLWEPTVSDLCRICGGVVATRFKVAKRPFAIRRKSGMRLFVSVSGLLEKAACGENTTCQFASTIVLS
mgnify:FL=1